mmetsp:Transcript_85647/g.199070  ORF Transcript_85647/g.199070 Transcript_85647/m.199070 type:complete len:394 (+) Transcript_85647:1-1182(+)
MELSDGVGSPGGRLCVLLHRILRHTLAMSARRQAFASLRISQDEASFLLEAEGVKDMLLYHYADKRADNNNDSNCTVPESGTNAVVRSFRGPNAVTSKDPEQLDGTVSDWANSYAVVLSWADSAMTAGDEGRSCKVLPRTKVTEHLGRLHERMVTQVERHLLKAQSCSSLPGTVWRLFLWQTPFGSCLVQCIFLTSTVRVIFFMVDVVGSLMMGTVFFEAQGFTRFKSRANCGGSGHPGEMIGRLLAIGVGSLVIASIPAIILGSLSTREMREFDYKGCPEWNRQLRIWRTQDRLIWVLSLLYISFCMFFMCVFFANVSAEDQAAWITSAATSVILNTVVIPLFVAVAVPLLGIMCLFITSYGQHVQKRELVEEAHWKMNERHTNLNLTLGTV